MDNKRTCLYDKHVALKALISPFGGFDMPIQYTNIVDEHLAVRQQCGVFDVSHMGEVLVSGPDAERFVNHIFTNDVTGMPDGGCEPLRGGEVSRDLRDSLEDDHHDDQQFED